MTATASRMSSDDLARSILNGRTSARLTVKQVDYLRSLYQRESRDYVKHRSFNGYGWDCTVYPNGAGILRSAQWHADLATERQAPATDYVAYAASLTDEQLDRVMANDDGFLPEGDWLNALRNEHQRRHAA